MADLVPAELGKQAMRLKRRIRRTRDLVRQHPRTSMAILVVGAGLLAGLIVGLAARARQQPQGLMSVILPR